MSPIDLWSSKINNTDDEDVLEKIIEGYKKYQVVYTAIEFGLFKYLAEKGQANSKEISEALGIKGMLTKGFLQVLVEMGLINQQDKIYSNSVVVSNLFSQNKILDRGNWLKYSGIQNPSWNNLKETLSISPYNNEKSIPVPSKEFIDCLAQRSLRGESQAILQAITEWDGFYQSKSVLDIGGGHALNSIALCQKNKNLHATVTDKPYVDQYIKEYQMEGRIVDLGIDIPIESISGEFDIVITSHYLYKHRKFLEFPFEKVYQLLKPGGLFVANHWFCEVGCAPEQSSISALDKAFLSFGHPLCQVEKFSRFFIGQGFSIISEKDIPSIYGSSRLHVAIKSQIDPTVVSKGNDGSECC